MIVTSLNNCALFHNTKEQVEKIMNPCCVSLVEVAKAKAPLKPHLHTVLLSKKENEWERREAKELKDKVLHDVTGN